MKSHMNKSAALDVNYNVIRSFSANHQAEVELIFVER